MNQLPSARVIFITGTDTGVGKTVLTALLLCHLRRRGCNALALKPFCSGGRADARLVAALQATLTLDEINPYHFREPIAPLAAARRQRKAVGLPEIIRHIQQFSRACDYLLVEGAGGLMAPLGEGFSALELIDRLRCEVIVVASNQLGVINHTLLTLQALGACGARAARATVQRRTNQCKVVLMECRTKDLSARSNPALLAELIAPVPVFRLPYLGPNCRRKTAVEKKAKRMKKTLAQILR
jgi:dethiobiotin synthetase